MKEFMGRLVLGFSLGVLVSAGVSAQAEVAPKGRLGDVLSVERVEQLDTDDNDTQLHFPILQALKVTGLLCADSDQTFVADAAHDAANFAVADIQLSGVGLDQPCSQPMLKTIVVPVQETLLNVWLGRNPDILVIGQNFSSGLIHPLKAP